MLRLPVSKVPELIVRLQQAGLEYRVPIYRAVAAGLIGSAECPRGSRVPAKVLKQQRPQLILLGDDDYAATGPDGWPQAPKLIRWARRVMIHATGGQAEHYALVVEATIHAGRTLLIETDMAHWEAWRAMVQGTSPGVPTLLVLTPPGQPPHPRLGPLPGELVQ